MDNNLTDFVYKDALLSWKKSQSRCDHQAQSMNELLKVELLVNLGVRLLNESFMCPILCWAASKEAGKTTLLVNLLNTIEVAEHVL